MSSKIRPIYLQTSADPILVAAASTTFNSNFMLKPQWTLHEYYSTGSHLKIMTGRCLVHSG